MEGWGSYSLKLVSPFVLWLFVFTTGCLIFQLENK